MVKKIFKDEEGFIVEKLVAEWVDVEEEVVPVLSPSKPLPAKPQEPKRPGLTKATKQGNLMGFFAKKPNPP